MLSVLESIIQQVLSKLFAFSWKNKKDKIKREVLYMPLSKGGLKFPCFGTMAKALPLSWISRFLLGSDESWKAIPNSYFNKLGGLPFILKCNYNAEKLSEKLPTFYRELLNNFEDMHQKTFILWNNKDITIDGKSVYWKAWFDKDIDFVEDLLNKNGNFLSLSELKDKCKLKTNFLRYQQIISAIPVCLRNEASQSLITRRLSEQDDNLFQLSKTVLILPKMRCKDY